MDLQVLARGVRRFALYYVVIDLMLGPLAVGAAFLGFTVWALGMDATLHYGFPWFPTMVAVGLSWAAIAIGSWKLSRRIVRVVR